jgi:hypothetical protein
LLQWRLLICGVVVLLPSRDLLLKVCPCQWSPVGKRCMRIRSHDHNCRPLANNTDVTAAASREHGVGIRFSNVVRELDVGESTRRFMRIINRQLSLPALAKHSVFSPNALRVQHCRLRPAALMYESYWCTQRCDVGIFGGLGHYSPRWAVL